MGEADLDSQFHDTGKGTGRIRWRLRLYLRFVRTVSATVPEGKDGETHKRNAWNKVRPEVDALIGILHEHSVHLLTMLELKVRC